MGFIPTLLKKTGAKTTTVAQDLNLDMILNALDVTVLVILQKHEGQSYPKPHLQQKT